MILETPGDVLKALVDGKKIRYSSWCEGTYLYLHGGYITDEEGDTTGEWCFENSNRGWWEVYEEPKPKKLYKWAIKDSDLKWYETRCYYATLEEVKRGHPISLDFIRLDDSAIEVDCE